MGWHYRKRSNVYRRPNVHILLRLQWPQIYSDPVGYFILVQIGGFYYRGYLRFHHPVGDPSNTDDRGQTSNKVSRPDPYQILGVPKSAAMDEISRAYRGKIKESHPDAATNKTPGSIAIAEQKTRGIIEAYNFLTSLSASRGRVNS